MNETLYTKALKYLGRRARSEKEIADYLRRKFATEKEIAEIIARLREQKFVNDAEFAASWVRERMLFRPKGWHALVFELKQKGIDLPILEQVRPGERELENAARELVTKKMKHLQGLSKEKIYQRLGGFLGRRGFDLDLIKRMIDEVLRNRV